MQSINMKFASQTGRVQKKMFYHLYSSFLVLYIYIHVQTWVRGPWKYLWNSRARNRSVGSPQERSTGGRGFEGFLGESRPCHGAQVSRLTVKRLVDGWIFIGKNAIKCHIDLKRMKQISWAIGEMMMFLLWISLYIVPVHASYLWN